MARALRTSTDVDDRIVKSFEVSSASLVSSRSSPQATDETRAITIKILTRLVWPRLIEAHAFTRDRSLLQHTSNFVTSYHSPCEASIFLLAGTRRPWACALKICRRIRTCQSVGKANG